MQADTNTTYPSHRFSVAPMLDWTDRHCRYFHRLFTRHALLYTEMVTTGAILHGKHDFLRYSEAEHPVALQLGGSDPQALATCAKLAAQRGYDELNLNVGCPSDRVQNGRFGACLMREPQLVGHCIHAMKAEVSLPVTVKCRIGIDQQDSYDFLCEFVQTVADSGCQTLIVHARKAWLSGLSPKQNREVPPLDYARVYRLKQDFPQLHIVLNGGINTLGEAQQHLQQVDGVMMGRAVYQHPALLAQVDRLLFSAERVALSEREVVYAFLPYIEQQLQQGVPLGKMTRHMLGLFQGMPGARQWRRYLSEQAHRPNAGIDVVLKALEWVVEGQVPSK